MKRSLVTLCVAAIAGSAWSGCASHRPSPENDPVALAALRAEVRVVRGETTWVTHGRGYELVGRTRADLVMVQPTLERTAAFLATIYPRDSVARITATVRRAPAPGKPFAAAAPVPSDAKDPQVELVLIDPKALEEQSKNNGRSPLDDGAGRPGAGLATPAIRAWLAARAAKLTDTPARAGQLRGESDGQHVPAWAVEMIATAGGQETVDNFAKTLAAHPEALIPLGTYFTMDRPAPMAMPGGRRGGGPSGGGPPRDGAGGMGGGRSGGGGGRGGARGGRGGMGGGFPEGGSSGASRGSPERNAPLQGLALFTAQSAVLSKYLARAGADVIGDLIDGQITGRPIDDVLAKHGLGGALQMEADWRGWLVQRGDQSNRR